MWYFAWILGTLLACALGVITALALELEQRDANRAQDDNA